MAPSAGHGSVHADQALVGLPELRGLEPGANPGRKLQCQAGHTTQPSTHPGADLGEIQKPHLGLERALPCLSRTSGREGTQAIRLPVPPQPAGFPFRAGPAMYLLRSPSQELPCLSEMSQTFEPADGLRAAGKRVGRSPALSARLSQFWSLLAPRPM